MQAVNWVCADALDEHVCVSEQTISLQEARVLEALQDDLEIPCVVQCGMFWFSAPASLNDELLNDGVTVERHNETVNLAFQSVFTLLHCRMNTSRSCFFRSIRTVLESVPERESGTRKGKWWVGDLVKGLICCLTMERVTP